MIIACINFINIMTVIISFCCMRKRERNTHQITCTHTHKLNAISRKFCSVSTLYELFFLFIPLVLLCTRDAFVYRTRACEWEWKTYLQSAKAEIYFSKCRQSCYLISFFLYLQTRVDPAMRIVANTSVVAGRQKKRVDFILFEHNFCGNASFYHTV